jgi:DNA-binding NtrC family response regulator
MRPSVASTGSASWSADATLEEVEIYWIRHVLERCGGNRTQAARRLGIDPSTLWRKLKESGA